MMKEIKAKRGKYLTQVADVTISERLLVTRVSGADDALASIWREATSAEVSAVQEYQRTVAADANA